MIKIINFKKTIKQLKEGSTYIVTFPDDYKDINAIKQTVDGINEYLREHHRDISFIYKPECIKVEEQSDETKRL